MTTYGTTSPNPRPEEGDLVLVAGGQGLGEPDQQAADQGAAGRVEAAEDRGREARCSATVATAGRHARASARRRANRPATAASAPATIQASMETRPSRMPISAAASPSSAAARIEMPQLEYLKVDEERRDEHGRPRRWRAARFCGDADPAEPRTTRRPTGGRR